MLSNIAVGLARAYFGIFKPKQVDIPIKKILVFANPGIGDCLTLTPAIRAIAFKYNTKIDLVCYPQTEPIFRHNPNIGKIYIGKTLKNMRAIRKEHYDMAVCYNLFTEPIYAYRCGIPIRCGEDKNGFALTHKFKPQNNESTISWLKRIAGVESDTSDVLTFNLDENITIPEAHGIIVIPDAGTTELAKKKMWSAENFKELCNLIGEPITICGLDKDTAVDMKFGLEVEHNDLTGQLDIMQLAAVIRKAKLVICNDSAAMHIAAAFNIPCLAIFGPTNPEWLAHKSTIVVQGKCTQEPKGPCFHKKEGYIMTCPRPCLTNLSAQEVYTRWKNESERVNKEA